MKGNYLLLCLFGISVCLLTKSVAHETIMGGTFAKPHHFPYQASIFISASARAPNCGAGIIKDRFVLTATHCVIGANNTLHTRTICVRAGTIEIDLNQRPIMIKKIYTPKQYLYTFAEIAVLKLAEPLQLENHHLQLPENEVVTYTHQIMRIAGFGWDYMSINGAMRGFNLEGRLRFADAKVLDRNDCSNYYPSPGMSENCFCARIMQLQRKAHRGVCVGDIGSPLVFNEKIVIGVLALIAPGCRESESPAIYTNVAHYRRFILHAVSDNMTEDMNVIDV